tara:strand:- start:1255 stop:1656 length:402 start_codon:yes stop_codon:yes gene_type:complete
MTVIFQDRGKQYKVKVGDFLKLPRLSNQKKNDLITFNEIIFIKNEKGESYIGSPLVKGVSINAKVIDQIRDKKIIVFKKKRRHNYRRKIGHRQDLTLVKIEEIKFSKSGTEKTSKSRNLEENMSVKKEDKNGS